MPASTRAQNGTPGGLYASFFACFAPGLRFPRSPALLPRFSCQCFYFSSRSPRILFSRVTQKEFSACLRNLPLVSKKNFKWWIARQASSVRIFRLFWKKALQFLARKLSQKCCSQQLKSLQGSVQLLLRPALNSAPCAARLFISWSRME